MPAPTTEDLVAILGDIQLGAFGDPTSLDASEALALLQKGTGIGAGQGNEQFFQGLTFEPAEQQLAQDLFGFDVFGPVGGAGAAAAPPASPFVGGAGGAGGELNIPFGSEFFDPTLTALMQLFGLGEQRRQFDITQPEQQRQFDVTAFQRAALALANLRAQGPQSAAELAFAQAGMGLPAIGGSAANITDLLGATTRGASGQTQFEAGGQRVNIPNTLGGQQLARLQGNPNLAGVLGSFSRAAGNPDIFARSQAALLPSGFPG